MMNISKNKLDLALAKRKITYLALSRQANINYSTLTRLKAGGKCNTATVGKIAAALAVDVTEIIETEAGASA